MRWFYQLMSPPGFYCFSGKILPWLWAMFMILIALGLYGALIAAPPDYQQGEGYRIIFIHVPAAWMSLLIYTTMSAMSVVVLVWRGKIAALGCQASALLGASFTLLTLVSGSFWGKPMWGAWWVWDARLTSELILLFLYLGYMALVVSIPNRRAAAQAGAILLLVGMANIPIIHFSVDWWNTLHQPATITKIGAPSIHRQMLWPLLVMALAFMIFYIATLFTAIRAALLEQEGSAKWAREALEINGRV